MSSNKSILNTEIKEFELESYGKDRTEAFGKIFSNLKKQAYASVNGGLVVQMEPLDVILVKEEEQSTLEKAVGFFRPRQLENYYVKVVIKVEMKWI